MNIFQKYLESYKDTNPKNWEVFNFATKQFNVSAAKNLIRKSLQASDDKIGRGDVDVEEWAEMIGGEIPKEGGGKKFKVGILVNVKHASKKKLNQPLIVATNGQWAIIIDGWHRLKKAEMTGIKTLPAYVIDDPNMLKEIMRAT